MVQPQQKKEMMTVLRFLLLLFVPFALVLHAAPLKILSLEGGGVQSIVTLVFLRDLERRTGLKCHEDFDLYAGTSAGSIIASLLACGVDIETIMEGYEKITQWIFSHPNMDQTRPKYETKQLQYALHQVMKKCGIPTDILIQQLNKKLVIPTVILEDPITRRWGPEIIDNIHPKNGPVRLDVAILESTAAPTYFPPYQGHVDGGIGMNDPSLVALATAFDLGDRDISAFTLLSIGTGYVKKSIKSFPHWGEGDWFWKGQNRSGTFPLMHLLVDVQQQLSSQCCKQLLGTHFLKIDLALPQETPLDAYRLMRDLVAHTESYIHDNEAMWDDHCQWVEEHLLKTHQEDAPERF